MRILAIEYELPGATPDDFRRLAKAEAARAWELYQAGVIRELYFRNDSPEAVLLLECSSKEDAAASLNTLPFVEAGLIVFEIIPLAPYPGFARLFASDVPAAREPSAEHSLLSNPNQPTRTSPWPSSPGTTK